MSTMDEESGLEQPTERPSKSALKREAQGLLELAETLLSLPSAQLAELELHAPLAKALEETRAITHREARRRQLRYLAKRIRDAGSEEIRQRLEQLEQRNRQFRQQLTRIDQLCEQLLVEGDPAIEALLSTADVSPGLERQPLRQLVRNARRTQGARRKLFEYLRRHLG